MFRHCLPLYASSFFFLPSLVHSPLSAFPLGLFKKSVYVLTDRFFRFLLLLLLLLCSLLRLPSSPRLYSLHFSSLPPLFFIILCKSLFLLTVFSFSFAICFVLLALPASPLPVSPVFYFSSILRACVYSYEPSSPSTLSISTSSLFFHSSRPLFIFRHRSFPFHSVLTFDND